MGFFSFFGRVLFASLFILSAWQMFNEFGDDGGPAAKEVIPKLGALNLHLSSKLGVELPKFDPRYFVAAALSVKAVGGFLFVFGSPLGAWLLILYLVVATPLLCDFYNYGQHEVEYSNLLNDFVQNVQLLGALLFFIGMKNLIPRRQPKKKAPKAKVS